ncbi:hypothetical protein PI125_g27121 [Phytophthora idaei]|nr:hypothetical protein PI125_g27121 [Phytophthora idaei]
MMATMTAKLALAAIWPLLASGRIGMELQTVPTWRHRQVQALYKPSDVPRRLPPVLHSCRRYGVLNFRTPHHLAFVQVQHGQLPTAKFYWTTRTLPHILL